MITIRQQQIDALRDAAVADFLARLAAHLVETAGVAADSAPAQAAQALAAAREFDLVVERDVAEFAAIVCRGFGGFPLLEPLPKPAQNLLLAYAVPGGDRLRRFAAWSKAQ